MRIIALDFETGGTDPQRHGPVSLGLAVMDGDTVTATFETLIGPKLNKKGFPEKEYDVTALSISGIKWPDIKKAPQPVDVWRAATEFVQDNKARSLTVVSHNASFDQAFWSQLRFMAGHFDKATYTFSMPSEILEGPWICTRRMASRMNLKDETLDTVAGSLGLSRSSELHGALEDAILAGNTFAKLAAMEQATA